MQKTKDNQDQLNLVRIGIILQILFFLILFGLILLVSYHFFVYTTQQSLGLYEILNGIK